MVVSTAKAPLVELTAEVRWYGRRLYDGLIERFGEIAASEGINRCEPTLAPRGLAGSHPPVMQYRPTDPGGSSPLYRLGDGVLSATALPPYKSWGEFEPKVRSALDILERTFGDGGEDAPRFNGAIMRYVDVFRPSAGGEPTLAHFADALGCRVELHAGLRSVCTDPRRIAPRISLTIPVAPGEMTIALAEATIATRRR